MLNPPKLLLLYPARSALNNYAYDERFKIDVSVKLQCGDRLHKNLLDIKDINRLSRLVRHV